MKVLYEKAPPRATITFNRPEVLNAFDHETLVVLRDACEQAAQDDEVRVVVLTGAGRAFCVGADLRAWADEGLVGNEREYWKWFRAMEEGVTAIRKIGKPTLARINGICVGGGNEMQMACDLAVMVDDAFIRHVGLQHGSVPAAGRDPVAAADRRGPPRARDRDALRGDPGGEGARVGPRQPGRLRRPSSTRPSTRSSASSPTACR